VERLREVARQLDQRRVALVEFGGDLHEAGGSCGGVRPFGQPKDQPGATQSVDGVHRALDKLSVGIVDAGQRAHRAQSGAGAKARSRRVRRHRRSLLRTLVAIRAAPAQRPRVDVIHR